MSEDFSSQAAGFVISVRRSRDLSQHLALFAGDRMSCSRDQNEQHVRPEGGGTTFSTARHRRPGPRSRTTTPDPRRSGRGPSRRSPRWRPGDRRVALSRRRLLSIDGLDLAHLLHESEDTKVLALQAQGAAGSPPTRFAARASASAKRWKSRASSTATAAAHRARRRGARRADLSRLEIELLDFDAVTARVFVPWSARRRRRAIVRGDRRDFAPEAHPARLLPQVPIVRLRPLRDGQTVREAVTRFVASRRGRLWLSRSNSRVDPGNLPFPTCRSAACRTRTPARPGLGSRSPPFAKPSRAIPASSSPPAESCCRPAPARPPSPSVRLAACAAGSRWSATISFSTAQRSTARA